MPTRIWRFRFSNLWRPRRWRGGLIDADPNRLPAGLVLPPNGIWARFFGFVRFVAIDRFGVSVTDISRVFGHWDWHCGADEFTGLIVRSDVRGAAPGDRVALVELVHKAPARSIVLHASDDAQFAAARGRQWAEALNLVILKSGDSAARSSLASRLAVQSAPPAGGVKPLA